MPKIEFDPTGVCPFCGGWGDTDLQEIKQSIDEYNAMHKVVEQVRTFLEHSPGMTPEEQAHYFPRVVSLEDLDSLNYPEDLPSVTDTDVGQLEGDVPDIIVQLPPKRTQRFSCVPQKEYSALLDVVEAAWVLLLVWDEGDDARAEVKSLSQALEALEAINE